MPRVARRVPRPPCLIARDARRLHECVAARSGSLGIKRYEFRGLGHRLDGLSLGTRGLSRPAEVLGDSVWHPGQLEAWREQNGRWRGYVRWTVGVGRRRLGWVDQDRLRPA
jgi:hypothetical protein